MRSNYSALALALFASSALAQNCPTGYKKYTVSWYDCPVPKTPTLQCSTLEVPLDYSQPAGKALKLRLVRIPASSATAQNRSVIYNPGGPGSGGIDSLIYEGNGLAVQKVVGTEFNIISFDPRGTGLSIPFECDSVDRPRDYKNTDGDLESLHKALSTQADECAHPDWKADNELMGTAYVARDIKAISEAIGEDNLIRYIGYSYGTLLGATTAAMFPESIGRMLLDGNINPTDYYYGLGDEAVADFDKAVARFFDLCAEAGPDNCAVAIAGQTGDQLRQRYDNFLGNLTYAQSYVVRDRFFDNLYSPSTFKNQAVTLRTYYNNTARIPRRALNRRAEGDDDEWNPTQSSEAETDMALAGITCGDWIARPEASVENFKKWRDIWRKTSKYGGDFALLSTLYQCSLWENDAKEKFTRPFTNIETKNPILFVNTQYDPVTPLVSAQNSSAGFINSRLLVSTGGGHCSNKQPSTELNEAIKKYFLDASFPKVNKIYDPDRPNAFISPPANTTKSTKTRRTASHAQLFKAESIVMKRQAAIPVGCVKSNSTSPGSISANGTGYGHDQHGGYSGGFSQSAGYGDYSGSTRTTGYGDYSGSTRSAGYGDYQDNYSGSTHPTQSAGYNIYGGYGSNPNPNRPATTTSVTAFASSVPCITSTLTEFSYETITKCPSKNDCQPGSVLTKTNVRTTVITLTASLSVFIGTPMPSASGIPRQGNNLPLYSVSAGSSKPTGTSPSAAFNPGYGLPAQPSSKDVVKEAARSSSTAVASQGNQVIPNRPSTTGLASNGTASSSTPTGFSPTQFTGGAASQHSAYVLISTITVLVISLVSL